MDTLDLGVVSGGHHGGNVIRNDENSSSEKGFWEILQADATGPLRKSSKVPLDFLSHGQER